MPTKMDGAGKRWVEMEFIAPGTPEDVWEAMATGPGNAAWFIRATIEERVGGAIAFDFGPDMKSTGESRHGSHRDGSATWSATGARAHRR